MNAPTAPQATPFNPLGKSVVYTSLVSRSLDLAAGTRTNVESYDKWGINLAKLQKLGKCYREGWLHNVLTRITPITSNESNDYLMMADLFVNNKSDAQYLCGVLSRSLSAFATVAGVSSGSKVVPIQLNNHVELYNRIASSLEERFGFKAPAPFASTTISREMQAQIPFIRGFLNQHFKVA
ncbi:MAG: hypothetical protein DI585_04570 [Pseudomonas fluorescens]|nr:MAG: hypothetical protein DI585_04570 [Pseudomonas fluorescens]